MTLQKGDKIGFDYAAQDIDAPDYTVWCEIREVVFEDGYRGYKVAFPDGEMLRSTILAKHVGRFEKAFPDNFCGCGLQVTPDSEFCPDCGVRWFPF